tara:strand:- start:1377 stop:2516 length:1140 start_codon:yes stop_codon:yes gene_type:complete
MFLDEVSAENQDFLVTSTKDEQSINDTSTLYLLSKQTIIKFLEAQGVSHELAKTIWKNPKSKQALLSGIGTKDPIICSDPEEPWRYCHILSTNDTVISLNKSGQEIKITSQKAEPQKSVDFGKITIKKSIFQDGELFENTLLNEINSALNGFIKSGHAIQPGDRVEFLYERKHFDQGFETVGHVVDVNYIGKKQSLHVSRFPEHHNYFFDIKGRSSTRGFLKFPVKFSYVSSPFSKGRKHPVYGVVKPHHGVDLAAKMNTPIHATSAGKVTHCGAKGGYGNTVILQHAGNYKTLYAHMRKFAPNLKVGDTVKAGQLIGFVGSTGISTGPHVHYEIRNNNVPIDPMKFQVTRSSQLSKKELIAHLQNQANWDMMRMSFNA